jgi:tight adherence protein B
MKKNVWPRLLKKPKHATQKLKPERKSPMFFGQDLTTLAITIMIAVAVGGVVLAILLPLFSNNSSGNRVKAIATGKKTETAGNSFRARFLEDSKDTRRRQIQESLKQVANTEKSRKKKVTLTNLLQQAGLDITPRSFWMASGISGIGFAVLSVVLTAPFYAVGIAAFVGFLGFPRWVLRVMRIRRQNKFLNDFADAVDVMVRGLKSGLPVSEAMKIIATETGAPVGPEFTEIVEGQRVGISIDQGMERMVERVPLPEVNFLSIVMTIQSKTGGNLSEALGNLSRVLRDRKKMKAKVKSVSQEAKSSAFIIGSLPFALIGLMTLMNPNYLGPLFHTNTGNMLVAGSAIWMLLGVLVMRQMMAFQI